MLTLTDSAIEVIRDLRIQPGTPPDTALRISLREGDGGETLAMSYAQTPAQGDQIIEAEDVRLYLQGQAAEILDDKVLDAEVTESGEVSFLVGELPA
jgi:Fe-S cluster assembly iron-binding protein IscA